MNLKLNQISFSGFRNSCKKSIFTPRARENNKKVPGEWVFKLTDCFHFTATVFVPTAEAGISQSWPRTCCVGCKSFLTTTKVRRLKNLAIHFFKFDFQSPIFLILDPFCTNFTDVCFLNSIKFRFFWTWLIFFPG